MDETIAALKKYNFWDNNTIDLGYLGTDYTEKIHNFIGNRLVKVLIGQRRSGKSFILSLDDLTFPSNKGIRHIQAWNFNEQF